jgi:menaquinone-dependent protoporphyrinogen oxidase
MSDMSRREFVLAGATVVAGVAVMASTGCTTPQRIDNQTVETPSRTYRGGAKMSGRVLVGYATRTGSTIGVAERIGEVLGSRGFYVDVKPIRERPAVDGYDAVVLGSAVNGAALLPEALDFVETNRAKLSNVPTCVFCVHSMNGGADEKQTRKRLAYLDKVRSLVSPVDEGFFLGKGPDPDDTGLIARWAFKTFGGSGEGDMRDWDKISSWAEQAHV